MTDQTEPIWHRLLERLSYRKCRGCADQSVHSHHLTWLGRRRFT